MATKIRLKRIGRRNRPFYRIIIIDSRKRRDGSAIEQVGWYNPIESNKEKNYVLKEVDFIDGTILINKQKIKNEIFDENFFIYFETMDLSKRLIDKNIKLFACEELTFEHFGGQSHEKKFDFEAQLSRCWHYNWSKFYYFKKHYGFCLALIYFLPIIIRINYRIFLYTIVRDKIKLQKYQVRRSGLFSSILNKKSFKRI